jgi:hypothetical protein
MSSNPHMPPNPTLPDLPHHPPSAHHCQCCRRSSSKASSGQVRRQGSTVPIQEQYSTSTVTIQAMHACLNRHIKKLGAAVYGPPAATATCAAAGTSGPAAIHQPGSLAYSTLLTCASAPAAALLS